MNNPWIGYIDRTYDQIKQAILTKITNPVSGIPEIVDLSDGNVWVKMIGVWAGIAEMLGYYTDNNARESFLSTCRFYKSAIKLARFADYKVQLNVSASVVITLSIDNVYGSDVTILEGTQVETAAGVIFMTTAEAVIVAGTLEIDVDALQYDNITGLVLATLTSGLANQEIIVGDNTIVEDSIQLEIDSVAWTEVDTFAFSEATDKHFVASVDEDGNIVVRFGDGVAGAIHASGYTVTLTYKTTIGILGNDVLVATITILSGSYPVTVSSTNAAVPNNGYGIESLVDLKNNIPRSIRTMLRAVTRQDYIDLLSLVSGVSFADVLYECGTNIYGYIYPVGGGIATDVFCTTVEGQVEGLFTHDLVCKPFGEVVIQISLTLNIYSNYSKTDVTAAVKTAMLEVITGSEMKISNVYQAIEGVSGVDNSEIDNIVITPYAHRFSTTTVHLSWTRSIVDPGGVTTEWKITMLSTTSFQLTKDNVYIGTYNAGVAVVQSEIEFTVNSAYTTGDSWTFVVYRNPYPSYGTLTLDEMSVLTSDVSNLLITIIGGV